MLCGVVSQGEKPSLASNGEGTAVASNGLMQLRLSKTLANSRDLNSGRICVETGLAMYVPLYLSIYHFW